MKYLSLILLVTIANVAGCSGKNIGSMKNIDAVLLHCTHETGNMPDFNAYLSKDGTIFLSSAKLAYFYNQTPKYYIFKGKSAEYFAKLINLKASTRKQDETIYPETMLSYIYLFTKGTVTPKYVYRDLDSHKKLLNIELSLRKLLTKDNEVPREKFYEISKSFPQKVRNFMEHKNFNKPGKL